MASRPTRIAAAALLSSLFACTGTDGVVDEGEDGTVYGEGEMTVSFTIDLEWIDLNEQCPADVDTGSGIGQGSVTVEWNFDPASAYDPGEDPRYKNFGDD